MKTSDWIALAALIVSLGSPAAQYAFHRWRKHRSRLELRTGLAGPGRVQVEAFFRADHGHRALIATLRIIQPEGTLVTLFKPGVSNHFTGEQTKEGFEDQDTPLPRSVQMIPVHGGERYRFMFAFIYHGHGTINPVEVEITFSEHHGKRLGKFRRTVFPIDYSIGGPP